MNVFKQRTYLIIQYVLSSLVYRLIIIVFGILIVLTHDNLIAAYYYTLLIPLYAILYIFLINDKWKYARLILDLVIVFAVLYGKTPLDDICFVYALFPLISSITHTGSHSKYWPVLVLTCIVFLILDGGMIIKHIVVAILIWLAGIQSWYSNKTNLFLSTITTHIDNYFSDNDGKKRPHEIYKDIIKEINSYLKGDYLKNIYSYTLKENNVLWLVNSSEFTWDRTLNMKPEFLAELKQRKFLHLKNNDSKYYYVEQRGVCYIYRCEINPLYERINYRKGYVVNYVLELTFGKVSTLLASEYRITETRRKAFEETKGHIDYVTRALKVMHFVRNKLSPINSVITFYSNRDKIESGMDPEKVQRMESRIKQEVNQAKKDLIEIVNTANYLLDKDKNPYGGTDIENKNIKFLFVILSEIVEHHLGSTVNVSDEIKGLETRKEVRVSMTQLKLLFTDIVSNIEKYKKTDYSIDMGVEGDKIIVTFMNEIDSKKESDCTSLVKDINNQNNEAIMLRKSHGVHNIKIAASLMDIELKAEMTSENKRKRFVLKTKFKMYDDYDDNKNSGN